MIHLPTPAPRTLAEAELPASAGLQASDAEALVRVIESAPQVRRRYHFFIWTQGPLQNLLPHQVSICGAYQRNARDLAFEAFHNVAVAQPLLDVLCESRGALQQAAQAAWVTGRGQPLRFDLTHAAMLPDAPERDAMLAAGYRHWLAHGVARPQRPSEIESFFMLGSAQRIPRDAELVYAELLLPHIHSAYLRMQALERELSASAPQRSVERPVATGKAVITVRERQILRWVRDGKNNQQIGEVLDISPLTVKNHIQKILRKLSATNRAQAVAKALALNLLPASATEMD